MTNRLADAISPYLRSHADNPVDWYPWGEEAFAAARARNVPVLVSIGYSTCHWCHVMARESFSDPAVAGYLNENFVAIKVDREEHPEVDTVYLAAAGAFTQELGWPLNVFVTPEGKAFYGGTYSPPTPIPGHPSFTQVLGAVNEAWSTRHSEVLVSADQIGSALASAQKGMAAADGAADVLAGVGDFSAVVSEFARYEDREFGGFGGAPKFPVAPVLRFLLEVGSAESTGSASRMLRAMAASELRDPVEGGFFRYATKRDWSEPHYERMLYDNALLLDSYAMLWAADSSCVWAREAAEGIVRFLVEVMQLPSGAFASAQDSESTVDGERVEGGYYRLDAEARARQVPPALDEKVLSGWNGLAIGALGRAALVFGRDDWAMAAEHAADYLLEVHLLPDGSLVRASIDGRLSAAAATLEDYGMLAEGLLRLSAVTGSVRYAMVGRMLVDAVIEAGLATPGGGDPLLRSQGLAVDLDPSEGAYPSGISAVASASLLLHALTADIRYREAAMRALAPLVPEALARPISFGATLQLLVKLSRPAEQLVLIEPDGGPVSGVPEGAAADAGLGAGGGAAAAGDADAAAGADGAANADGGMPRDGGDGDAHEVADAGGDVDPAGPDEGDGGDVASAARADGDAQTPDSAAMQADGLRAAVRMWTGAAIVARATESEARMLAEAGFELFADRVAREARPTAYRCFDFVCRLPATTAAALRA
jgi:uncharacterized protein YyaL (SSP411 family)